MWRKHRGGSGRDRVVQLLERVGISGAAERLNQYPHQLSGGLRQRVMIAMALLCEPQLVIADEPTTALDVTVQAQILALLASLQREFGMALILITHDFGVVSQIADHVAVMYAGQIVETGSTRDVLDTPLHPYTRALLECIPEPGRPRLQPLGVIPGMVPSRITDAPGCTFANRCSLVSADCRRPPVVPLKDHGNGRASRCILPLPISNRFSARRVLRMTGVVMEARDVHARFRVGGGLSGPARTLRAVNGVSLQLRRGEVLGLVGESGCGKSTLSKILLGLQSPTSGEVYLDGGPLSSLGRKHIASCVQPIFQDPFASLNARQTVGEIVGLPLRVHREMSRADRRQSVKAMLDRVGIAEQMVDVFPHELSGGQRQRVAIARALILRPPIVICDEPTSALDVSVQAQILNLLMELQRELGTSYLLISHNLGIVEHIASRVAVMYAGRIVEVGETEALFRAPQHPYTQALLAAVPRSQVSKARDRRSRNVIPESSRPSARLHVSPALQVCERDLQRDGTVHYSDRNGHDRMPPDLPAR